MNNKQPIKRITCILQVLVLIALTVFFSGCESDSSSDSPQISPVTSPYLICNNRNPGGVGIDLDSGKAYNLDDYPTFDWDIRIKTYKGVSGTTPSLNGAPFIKMKGTVVKSYTWGSTGNTAYQGIALTDITSASFTADPVSEVDLATVDTVQSGDFTEAQMTAGSFTVGNYYYSYTGKTGLKQKYTTLIIGEGWKSAAANTDHTDDKIYIIQSDEGNYFKLIITDFGPNSDIGQSGYIAIQYEEL